MWRGLCVCGAVLLIQGCSLDWDFKIPDRAEPKDGGASDGGDDGDGDGGSRRDRDASTDGGDGSDAGGDSGIDTPPMLACMEDDDCVDTDRYACVSHECVEHECHTTKPCKSGLCDDHACVEFVPPERLPTGYAQTSGGGSARSSKYSLRFFVGAPQPFGKASGKKHRLILGPGAGRP